MTSNILLQKSSHFFSNFLKVIYNFYDIPEINFRNSSIYLPVFIQKYKSYTILIIQTELNRKQCLNSSLNREHRDTELTRDMAATALPIFSPSQVLYRMTLIFIISTSIYRNQQNIIKPNTKPFRV